MADAEVRMNLAGCTEIRNSAGAQAAILARANAIAARATASGCKSTADVMPGRTRAHARVKPATKQASEHNATYNTILKSMGAGR